MSFRIGENIVAIKDHSQYAFKKGDVFPVYGLKKCFCGCGNTIVDIGLSDYATNYMCNVSGKSQRAKDNIWWFLSRCFRPLDELADITELTEILENTKPFGVK